MTLCIFCIYFEFRASNFEFEEKCMTPSKDVINKVLNFINADELINLTADLVRINSARWFRQPPADV